MLRLNVLALFMTAFMPAAMFVQVANADDTDSNDQLRIEIAAEMEAATIAYDLAMETARDRIAKLLRKKINLATSRGDLESADSAKKELENFLVNNQKPRLVTTKGFVKTRERELLKLIRIHEDGVRRLTKSRMADDARKLKNNLEALKARELEPPLKGIFNEQLLINPGCEELLERTGFVGWDIVAGGWRRSVDNPDPKTGEGSFTSISRRCRLVQTVAIDDELDGFIDRSLVIFNLQGELWRGQKADTGRIEITFLDTQGREIESFGSGNPSEIGRWQSVSVEGPVPAGTESVRVNLSSFVIPGKKGGQANVWFDDIDLRLKLNK